MDDRMYYRRRRRRHTAHSNFRTYFYPFVILCLIVFGVYLLIQAAGYLLAGGADDVDIKLYVEQGSVEVTLANETSPVTNVIPTGHPLQPLDRVKTQSSTRAVLEFFGSDQLRLAPNSEVLISEVQSSSSKQEIVVELVRGQAWANVVDSEVDRDHVFTVSTQNVTARSLGTIFDTKANFPEYVRVLEGNVEVTVKADEGDKIEELDVVPVSIAQEFTLTQQDLQAFIERDVPAVLGPISEVFQESDWYLWNETLDENPQLVRRFDGVTKVVSVNPIVPEDDEEDPDQDEEENEDSTDEDDADAEEDDSASDDDSETDDTDATADLDAPVITEPETGSVQTENLVQIRGTTDSGTEAVEVIWQVGESEALPYRLQRYEAGSTEWLYVASYSGGNMVVGENTYLVYALDAEGNRSATDSITIEFELTEETDPEGSGVTIEPVDTEESAEDEGSDSEDSVEEAVLVPSDEDDV